MQKTLGRQEYVCHFLFDMEKNMKISYRIKSTVFTYKINQSHKRSHLHLFKRT